MQLSKKFKVSPDIQSNMVSSPPIPEKQVCANSFIPKTIEKEENLQFFGRGISTKLTTCLPIKKIFDESLKSSTVPLNTVSSSEIFLKKPNLKSFFLPTYESCKRSTSKLIPLKKLNYTEKNIHFLKDKNQNEKFEFPKEIKKLFNTNVKKSILLAGKSLIKLIIRIKK
jgi:hypothetical protein